MWEIQEIGGRQIEYAGGVGEIKGRESVMGGVLIRKLNPLLKYLHGTGNGTRRREEDSSSALQIRR